MGRGPGSPPQPQDWVDVAEGGDWGAGPLVGQLPGLV